jgi:EcsC protein family
MAMVSKSRALSLVTLQGPRNAVENALLDLVIRIPNSRERAVEQPQVRAQALARSASRQASLVASSMALPPGFWGWLTVLPELIAVWKLQTQMVSDIAAVYGKSASMGREQMMYCLFKHVSAQLFRDVVTRVGERVLVQKASSALVQSMVKKLGLTITQSLVGKSASRFLPIIGAVGVGAYAYYDTSQVAKTAIELFSKEIVLEDGVVDDVVSSVVDAPLKRARPQKA